MFDGAHTSHVLRDVHAIPESFQVICLTRSNPNKNMNLKVTVIRQTKWTAPHAHMNLCATKDTDRTKKFIFD